MPQARALVLKVVQNALRIPRAMRASGQKSPHMEHTQRQRRLCFAGIKTESTVYIFFRPSYTASSRSMANPAAYSPARRRSAVVIGCRTRCFSGVCSHGVSATMRKINSPPMPAITTSSDPPPKARQDRRTKRSAFYRKRRIAPHCAQRSRAARRSRRRRRRKLSCRLAAVQSADSRDPCRHRRREHPRARNQRIFAAAHPA